MAAGNYFKNFEFTKYKFGDNTNQDTFMLFMRHLVQHLDQTSPGWQESSVIMLDNAPYHTAKKIKRQFKRM